MLTPKQKSHLELGIGVAAFAGLIALFLYVYAQTQKLKDACFAISGGSLNNISESNVSITLFVSITNISDFTITLNSINLDVYLNDMYITTISQNISQQLVSHAKNNTSVSINFSPSDLLKAGINAISDILSNQDNVIIHTVGTCSVSGQGVVANNVSIDDTITLAQIENNSKQPSNC